MQEVEATLQFAVSVVNVVPSLWRIATVYAVIAEPPLNGAIQLIVTLTLVLVAVVGGPIMPGIAAALIETKAESAPRPTRFLALTLKV